MAQALFSRENRMKNSQHTQKSPRRAGVFSSSFVLPLAALVALFMCPTSSHANEFPKRKAGLWEISVETAPGLPGSNMKQCIDEKTDGEMMASVTEVAKQWGGNCAKNLMKKTAKGYEGEAECQYGGSKMVSRSVLTGDFQSAYEVETTASFNPPFMGQTGNTSKIKAKWVGPCADGMAPGDTLFPNGVKINYKQLVGNAGK